MISRFIGRRRTAAATTLLAVAAIGLAACGSSGGGAASPSGSGAAASQAPVSTLRVGFFPNVTHAPAFVALQEGFLKTSLKEVKVKVAPSLFNAGPDAVTALFGDSIDISYIGPNPTVNAWTQSQGEAVTVISGAASGGASLVVKPELTDAGVAQGQDAGDAAARQHPGRGAALLAQAAGPRHGRPDRLRRRQHHAR